MTRHLLKALAGPALFLAPTTGLAHDTAPDPIAPLATIGDQDDRKPGVITPTFSAGELKQKAAQQDVVKLRAIPMPDGSSIDVDLRPWSPFGPDCALQFSRAGARGKSVQRILDMQEVTFLKGHVRGKKDSVVMIAAKDDRMEGFFTYAGSTAELTRDRSEGLSRDVIRTPKNADPLPPEEMGCGTEFDDLVREVDAGMPEGGLAGETPDCSVIRLALEIDHDLYTNRLNQDGLATLVYVAKLLYSTDEVIRRSLGAQIELSSVNVWFEPDDPWTMGTTATQLNQFMDYCNDPANNMLVTPRDATILLSSRALGGGRAGGIGALACDRPEVSYAVCGSLAGDFPYPANDYQANNWDIYVFIHELGHLLDALHTHDYDPPLDTCFTERGAPQRGTVMSYCHLCSGGSRNMGLGFHMRNQERARGYFAAIDCLEGRSSSILAYDDESAAYRNSNTRIDVLENDSAVCSGSFIHGFDQFTQEGGLVRLEAGAGPLGRDVLRYMPRRDFLGTDSFSYQAIDGHGNISMAQVVVEVEPAPHLTDPEYLVLDTIDNSISRFDAETREYKGDFLPEFPEFLHTPTSILPLPDTSVLVGDRTLQKVFQVDINGEYQGVFFDHHHLIDCVALVESGEQVFILDAYGGWVFRTGLSGGYEGALFEGTGTGTGMAMGDDGTLWIIGSVEGNELIGIDSQTGAVVHEIPDLEGIDTPAAIAFINGEVMVADGGTGAVGLYDPNGSGGLAYQLISASRAGSNYLGGAIQFSSRSINGVLGEEFGLVTSEGAFRIPEPGTVLSVERNGGGPLQAAGAIALRSVPETSPDLNQDGCVDGGDLSLLLSYFGQPTGSFPRADLDLNGIIDGADLSTLLGGWTGCP